MKKILSFSPLAFLGLAVGGLLLSVGGMWHQHNNQKQLTELSTIQQGVGTCFNRVSQTFTATMIKDWKSSYLERNFMNLSDDCLSEAIKGMKPFKTDIVTAHKTLQQLVSEVHWFHESALKTVTLSLAGTTKAVETAPLLERYKKIEEHKITFSDEVEAASADYRKMTTNDQVAVTLGILGIFMAIAGIMFQENQKNKNRAQIEARALGLLESSKFDNSAVIDQIVDEALMNFSMTSTAQLFRDYNGEMLEKQSMRYSGTNETEATQAKTDTNEAEITEEDSAEDMVVSSLRDVLVTIQNIHGKENINTTDVREVRLAIDNEAMAQVTNAAITKLLEHKTGNKRIQVSNQVHSDRTILHFFLKEATFNVSELEFASGNTAGSNDLNLILLNEICADNNVQWFAENKVSRTGSIEGMNIRMVVKRASKSAKKNLVSVVRGKKRDLQSSMMN